MSDQEINKNSKEEALEKESEPKVVVAEASKKNISNTSTNANVVSSTRVTNNNFPKKTFRKNIRSRKPRSKFERPKPEFDQKIIKIRRVTRVVKGGRRFSFSVAMVLGNKKGSVGVGVGKASDTALAIEKAIRNAKKNMIKLRLTDNMSVPYEVGAKYCSSEVLIRPAKGRGIVAGSSVRTVLELAGITEVGSKLISRSKNKLNNAKVAIKALSSFKV